MKDTLQTGSHTVYALHYHFVAVTKYRATILIDTITERIGEIANDLAGEFGVDIQTVNGGNDHIHILFTAEPTTELTKFINSLESVTSRTIRIEYPDVKHVLEDSVWQPGYFRATTGQVSIDVLMDDVEAQ